MVINSADLPFGLSYCCAPYCLLMLAKSSATKAKNVRTITGGYKANEDSLSDYYLILHAFHSMILASPKRKQC